MSSSRATLHVILKGKSNWITDEQLRQLSAELETTFGHDSFAIDNRGNYCPIEILDPTVDPYNFNPNDFGKDDEEFFTKADDEQYLEVNTVADWYSPDVCDDGEDDWPLIRGVAEWCERQGASGIVC
jgi:hypothetical protein